MKKIIKSIKDRNFIFFSVRIIVAFLLFWAIGGHGYSYYNLLRIIVFVASIYGIYKAIKIKKIGWIWIFGLICLIFNPIAKVELEKDYWIIIDTITGTFFIFSIFFFNIKKNLNKNKKRIFSFILISLILFTFSQVIKKEKPSFPGEDIEMEEIEIEEIE